MGKYIDTDKMFSKILKDKKFAFRQDNMIDEEVIIKTVYKDLADFINSLPEENVRKVINGKWIKSKGMYVTCSICGFQTSDFIVLENNISTPYFCGKCGATMRGEFYEL